MDFSSCRHDYVTVQWFLRWGSGPTSFQGCFFFKSGCYNLGIGHLRCNPFFPGNKFHCYNGTYSQVDMQALFYVTFFYSQALFYVTSCLMSLPAMASLQVDNITSYCEREGRVSYWKRGRSPEIIILRKWSQDEMLDNYCHCERVKDVFVDPDAMN